MYSSTITGEVGMLWAFVTEESEGKPRALPTELVTAQGSGRLGAAPASDGSMMVYLDGEISLKGPSGDIPPGMMITIGDGEDIPVTVGGVKYRLFVKEAW